MILNRDGSTRRDSIENTPISVPEMGRILRRARTRQGLRIEDVYDQIAIPVADLESLESGTIDRMPDRVQLLKALRRYAEFLGLPGDRFALTLIDRWPDLSMYRVSETTPPRGIHLSSTGLNPTNSASTSVWDTQHIGGTENVSSSAKTTSIPAINPDSGYPQRSIRSGSEPGVGSELNSGFNAEVLADTSIVPAISSNPKNPPNPKIKKPRAPVALRLTLVLVTLLLVIGVGLLYVHIDHPNWLSDISLSGTSKIHSSTPINSSKTNHSHAHSTTKAPIFKIVSQTSSSASINLTGSSFTIKVIAVGFPCWVQATNSTNQSSTYAQVLNTGATKSFVINSSLNLQIGASSGHIFVQNGSKTVGFFFPPSAPFTMHFKVV